MNIEYARQQLANLFFKDKKRSYILIGVVVFTLVVSLAVHGVQSKKARLLFIERDAEVKKSSLLNQINISDKIIRSYKDFFRPRDVFLVMNAVSDIAKSSGIKLVSIKPDPGKDKNYPFYTRYFFDLAIEANSYHAVAKFISHVEDSPDAYFVDALSITMREEAVASAKESVPESRTASKLAVNMVLSIIVFKG